MATFTQIYYHIVFATKGRERVLTADRRRELYRYFLGVLNNKQCHVYRIGGTEDHVHFLIDLRPSATLANLVKDLKLASSQWIKKEGVFPGFDHWQSGYGAFTHSASEQDRLVEYIKNQETHHCRLSFQDELAKLLKEAGIEFEERFLE